ncbi:MAG: hypothetical protein IJA89_04090 [Clostridia bacterium]|nr:hypothetical protein [Clostridia bacterium]
MEILLKSDKTIEYLSGTGALNANDVLYHKFTVKLERALSVQESLWVTFKHAEALEYTHDILMHADGNAGEIVLPHEVTRVAGAWEFQLFIRRYHTYATRFWQSASWTGGFVVTNGLQTDEADAPVNNASIGSLYESAQVAITGATAQAEKAQTQADRAEEIANNLDGTTTPSGGAYVKYDEYGGVNVSETTFSLQKSHAAPVSWVQGQMESLKTLLDEQIGKKFDKEGGTVGGSVTVTGDLTVQGTTRTNDTETLSVKDNVIVTNAEGAELADNSGLVIRTGATTAYAVAYNPATDGVTIGEGTLSENGEFTYTAGEAQYLATIDWGMANGNLPKFNQTTKRLEDSGIPADEVLTKTAAPKFWRLI